MLLKQANIAPRRSGLLDLVAKLREAEDLLDNPCGAADIAQAEALLVLIARNASDGAVADLAMRATTLCYLIRRSYRLEQTRGTLDHLLRELRLKLRQAS